MNYFIAHTTYRPDMIQAEPLEFKTTVFEGATADVHSLGDVYTYFRTNPSIMVLHSNVSGELWGDMNETDTIMYPLLDKVWGTTPLPSMPLRWDIFACDSNGMGGTYFGDVKTPPNNL